MKILLKLYLTVAALSAATYSASFEYSNLNLELPSSSTRTDACKRAGTPLYLDDPNCMTHVIAGDLVVCNDLEVEGDVMIATGFNGEEIFDDSEMMSRSNCVVTLDSSSSIVESFGSSGTVVFVGKLDIGGTAKMDNLLMMSGAELTIGSDNSMETCDAVTGVQSNDEEPVSLLVKNSIDILSGTALVSRRKIQAPRIVIDDGAILISECGTLHAQRDGDEASGLIVSDGSVVMNQATFPNTGNIFAQLVITNGSEMFCQSNVDVLSLVQLDNGSKIEVYGSVFAPIVIVDDSSMVRVNEDLQAPVLLNLIDGSDVAVNGGIDAGVIQVYDGSSLAAVSGATVLKTFVVESSSSSIGNDLVVGGKVHIHNGASLAVQGDTRITDTLQLSSSQFQLAGDLSMLGHIVLSAGSQLDVQGDITCAGLTQKDIDALNRELAIEKDALESKTKSKDGEVDDNENANARRLESEEFMKRKPTESVDIDESIVEDPLVHSVIGADELAEMVPTPALFCSHSAVRVGGEILRVVNSWVELKQCEVGISHGDLVLEPRSGLLNAYLGSVVEVGGYVEAGTALLLSKNSHLSVTETVKASVAQINHSSTILADSLDIELDLQVTSRSRIVLSSPLELGKLTSILVNWRSSMSVPSITRVGKKKEKSENDGFKGSEGAIFITGRSELVVRESDGMTLDESDRSTLVVQDGSVVITEGPIVFSRKLVKSKSDDIANTQGVIRVENNASVLLMNKRLNPPMTCYRTADSSIKLLDALSTKDVCDEKTSQTLLQSVPGLLMQRLDPDKFESIEGDAWDRYGDQVQTKD